MHRWQGTSGAKGLFRNAPPTARGDEFNALDMAAYVVTFPRGICLSRA